MSTTPIIQPPRRRYYPLRRKTNRLLTTLVILCPMVLLAIAVSGPATFAQEPPTECWACGRVKCDTDPDNTIYRGCTKAMKGTRSCGPLPVPDCPPPGSCELGPNLCPSVMALAEPQRSRVIRAFERGGMLPSDGAFYVAIRGDQLVLRQKCGTQELARMAAKDVGRMPARVALPDDRQRGRDGVYTVVDQV